MCILFKKINLQIGNTTDGYIAIDNLSYNLTISAPKTLDCNFDANTLCDWYTDPASQFSWTLNKGPTNTILTGPSVDHTTTSSSGYYIYMNANSPQAQPNSTAQVFSPYVKLKENEGGCLQFFYHMFGPDVNQLNLYTSAETAGVKPVWQKKFNKGDKWLFGHFNIETTQAKSSNILFVFEGVVSAYFLCLNI